MPESQLQKDRLISICMTSILAMLLYFSLTDL